MVSKSVVQTAKAALPKKKMAGKYVEKALTSADLLLSLEPPPGLKKDGAFKMPSEQVAVGAPMLPPGLELPPGLDLPFSLREMDAQEACPPKETESAYVPASAQGLHPTECQQPVAEVSVSGLPNDILSDIMFEAVMQQAGLDGGVADYLTRPGVESGEAIIRIYHPHAVQQCLNHFNGCQWLSGMKVSATVVEPSVAAKQFLGAPLGSNWQMFEKEEPASIPSLLADLAAPKKVLPGSCFDELASPAKIDISGLSSCKSVQATKMPPQGRSHTALSAEARAFVPPSSAKVPSDRSVRDELIRIGKHGLNVAWKHTNSEISTEIGESEGEDRDATEVQEVASLR